MSLRTGIIFAIGLLLSAVLLLSLEREAVFPVPQRTGSSLENIRMTHSEEGQKVWELEALRADLGQEMKEAILEEVTLRIEADQPVEVTGRKGYYRFDQGRMSITEGAVVRTTDWTLITEKLDWEGSDGRVTTDQEVTMEARSFTVRGTGMEVDTRKETARVSNVTCTFHSY